MKSKRHKSLKSFHLYQILVWSIIVGSFVGYYLLIKELLHFSTEISITIILSGALIISSGVIALFQVIYKDNFSNDKIFLLDNYFLKLSNITIIILQNILIVCTIACVGYSVLQIMVDNNMLIGICFAFVGTVMFFLSIPLWRYTIYKKIEFYD